MSVLIHNMEMPTEGEMLCINIYPDGKVCINLDLECKQIATAVPIPPHGDLIDRNEMFIEFVVEGQKSTRYKVGEKWELNGEEIRRVIQQFPAVIPAEGNGCGRCDHCRINETGTCRYAEEDEK